FCACFEEDSPEGADCGSCAHSMAGKASAQASTARGKMGRRIVRCRVAKTCNLDGRLDASRSGPDVSPGWRMAGKGRLFLVLFFFVFVEVVLFLILFFLDFVLFALFVFFIIKVVGNGVQMNGMRLRDFQFGFTLRTAQDFA